MQFFEFWNQLKKRIKRQLRGKRGLLNLAVVLLAVGIVGAWVWLSRSWIQTQEDSALGSWKHEAVLSRSVKERKQPEEEVRKMLTGTNEEREAFMKRAFICGEELERIGMMNANSILEYYREHPSVTVTLGDGNTVFFIETVDDLAPACKENAYFGLDSNGNLSLFEGVPGSGSENVIRTFFQLNVESLESSLPRETVRQLYQGIRVHDLEDYNSVLSTLSDYAVEETEKAMQPAPSS